MSSRNVDLGDPVEFSAVQRPPATTLRQVPGSQVAAVPYQRVWSVERKGAGIPSQIDGMQRVMAIDCGKGAGMRLSPIQGFATCLAHRGKRGNRRLGFQGSGSHS
jgi:hypothetical protein